MDAIAELDVTITQALTSLARELSGVGWSGRREREVVSLFCFGHLLRQCKPGGVLYDPTQVAIEVAVPQIPGQRNLTGSSRSKAQVCKDIVIWPRPGMVTWGPQGKPLWPPSAFSSGNTTRLRSAVTIWIGYVSSRCVQLNLWAMRSVPTSPLRALPCRVLGFSMAGWRLNGFISSESRANY